MKYLHKLLLTLCLIFGFTQAVEWQPTSQDTGIAFDIDDVIAEHSFWRNTNLVMGGIWQDPLNSYHWISSLMNIKNAYQKDADGKREKLLDEQGNPINGVSFQFLYHGMRDRNITPYVPFVVESVETSRTPIEGTIELCQYLKQKGYTLVFATNKDRPSYDAFAQAIGTKITSLAKIIFVAHPGNNNMFLDHIKKFITRNDVPQNYKTFARKALTVKPTEHIRHIPTIKPYPAYYQYVHEVLQQELGKENMIFIDDKQTNIDGVEKYSKQQNAHVVGITFKNPYQLAQHLVKLGVLSPEKDKLFLEKIKQYR